jgi:raffinose/stachyose/melibiose transport system substrate-binding protein
MMDLATTPISRRRALRGFGGVVLGASLPGILGACGGSSARSTATQVSAWSYRPEYKKAIGEIVSAFEAANPGISVDMTYKTVAQYPTVLKTALVGGAGPEAIATNGANGIWGDVGADGGYIVPLDGKVDVGTLQPTVAKAVTYKGHVYGAPVQTFRIGVYYQRPVFEELGLSEPQTWDDLLTLGTTLKEAGKTAWAMPAQDMTIPYFFYHLAVDSILAGESVTALASGKRKLTEPELVKAAQLMIDASDTFDEGFEAVGYTEGKALFAQGQAAMIIGGSSDYAGYLEINPEIDVGFFGFPSPDGKNPPTALNGLSMAYVVNKEAANLEAATTFTTWLTSRAAQKIVLEQLGLPSVKGLKPTGSSPRDEVLRTILGVSSSPSWLDYPATGETMVTAQKAGSGIFTGDLTAAQFAAVVQNSITTTSSS